MPLEAALSAQPTVRASREQDTRVPVLEGVRDPDGTNAWARVRSGCNVRWRRVAPVVRGLAGGLLGCAAMSPRALIVDDHEATRMALREYFESAGFAVDTAGSLKEAVALIQLHPYSIAFTDLRLNRAGHADGLEVVSAARRHAPDSPVVLLTSVASPPVRAEAKRRGACAVLLKPQRLEDLLRLARQLASDPSTSLSE